MRLGLFGGSFDPFHFGHLAVARAAFESLGLDRVVVAPTARPPHKPGRRFAPALARYAMVEIALLDEPDLVASSLELGENAESFTVDTIARIRAEAAEASVALVIGSDSLAELHTWRRWEEILEHNELAVVPRPGAERERVEAGLPAGLAARLDPSRVHWLDGAWHPASASEIRRRRAAAEPIPEGWLDQRVVTFLDKYSLYR